MIELTLTFDRKVVNTFNFDKDTVLIGRDPTCDVRIDNVGISRHHARIEKRGAIFTLVDLDSGNGTYVRGKRITQHNLNNGDEIGLWNFSLVFKTSQIVEETVAPPKEKAAKIDPEMTIAVDVRQLDLKQRERSGGAVGYLVYEEPKRGQRTFSLMKTITFFGKDKDCAFILGGWFIQPRHAIIVRDETGFRFINCAARHQGTVNGAVVNDHRLQEGDVIRIASKTFKYFKGMPSAR